MSIYSIVIEETVVKEIEVASDTEEEALEIAYRKYKDEKIVLDPGEVQYVQMAVVKPHIEKFTWVEI